MPTIIEVLEECSGNCLDNSEERQLVASKLWAAFEPLVQEIKAEKEYIDGLHAHLIKLAKTSKTYSKEWQELRSFVDTFLEKL